MASAILLWFAHALLAPGLMVTGDAGSHVARINHFVMAIRDGSSLYWDNYFYGGGTSLQFTGPIFHWLAALLSLALGDTTAAVKCVVVAGRFLSAWAMYLFLRRIGLGRTAATLGAIFYGGAFFQTAVAASVRSAFPQVINLACLPAMLLFAETVLTKRAVITPAWIGLCLTAIAMVGSHQPTAVMAAIFVGLYLGARSVMLGSRACRLLPLALAGLVVTVGSVYFVVPFLAEKSWTGEDFASAIIAPHTPTWRELRNFVAWGATGAGPDASSYLGVSVLAVILLGAAASLRPGPRGPRIFLGTFVALTLSTLVLEGSYVRQALFTSFFVCAAAAAAVQVLTEALPARPALPLAILIAFLLDVGPTAVQPWTRPDMRALERAGHALAARAAGQRVVEAVHTANGFFVSVGPDSSPLHYARVQMLYGVHKMEATKAHNAMVAVLKLAEADLNAAGTLRPDTVGLLSLYNVGWLVGRERDRMGRPASVAGTIEDDVVGDHLRIPTATPVLASGRLTATPEPAAFTGRPFGQADFAARSVRAMAAERAAQNAYHRMDVDWADRRAGAILVPSLPAGEEWPSNDDETPNTALRAYQVEPGEVRLTVDSERPAFLRLSHPFHPSLRVIENGRAIEPIRDIFSMLVIPVQAGRNHIAVMATPSTLRLACLVVTAVCTAGLLASLFWLLLGNQVRRLFPARVAAR